MSCQPWVRVRQERVECDRGAAASPDRSPTWARRAGPSGSFDRFPLRGTPARPPQRRQAALHHPGLSPLRPNPFPLPLLRRLLFSRDQNGASRREAAGPTPAAATADRLPALARRARFSQASVVGFDLGNANSKVRPSSLTLARRPALLLTSLLCYSTDRCCAQPVSIPTTQQLRRAAVRAFSLASCPTDHRALLC